MKKMRAKVMRGHSLEERFAAKVDRSGGPDACHPWTAAASGGYGVIGDENGRAGKNLRANRLAWTLANGPIPEGLHVCHHCDNPPCCNPAHLFVGTRSDNLSDAARKGRLAGRRVPRGEEQPRSKLTEQSVAEIRRRAANGESGAALGRAFGVHKDTASLVIRRATWKHVP